MNKDDVRLPLVRRRAAEAGAAVAYVNMVGGQDELVFDGDSMIVAADGTLLARAPQFVDQLLVHDVELPAADPARPVADGLGGLPALVGYLDADGPATLSAAASPDHGPRNALAVLYEGRVVGHYYKHHLPNYGVFDEDRYFVAGDTLTVARIAGVDVALTICEDLWQTGGPFAVARQTGVGLVVSVNGSPYELNKDDVRLPLVRRRAAE
ncbi:nitrilase-related carbon-nitrogen hydrolase, partial [Micromonospora zhanjiangensis]